MSKACMDCKERYVGCHGFCEKYKEYSLLREEFKQLKRKEHDIISARYGRFKGPKKNFRKTYSFLREE